MNQRFIPAITFTAAGVLAGSLAVAAALTIYENRSADPQPVVKQVGRVPAPSFTQTPTARSTAATNGRSDTTQDNGKDHDQSRDPRVISKPKDPSHPKTKITVHSTKGKTSATTPSTTRLAPQSDEPVEPSPTPAGEDIAVNQDPTPVTDPSQQPIKPVPTETTPPPPPSIPNPQR